MSELPEGWVQVLLGDIAEITSGIGFPKEFQGLDSGDLAFFKVGDISRAVLNTRGYLSNADHYVSQSVARQLKGKPLKPGTTVFAKIGEAIKLSRRAFVQSPCLVDNNVMGVKAYEGQLDRFVFLFLQATDFSDLSRATTVPSLRKGDIESLLFPLPPLAEQKRIADKLDTLLARVDRCRARLDRVPLILKRFRQAVLAAATSGQLTEDWREENGLDSKQWMTCRIGDVVTIKNGRSFPSSDYSNSGTRLVRPGNLHVSGKVEWREDNTVYLPNHYVDEYPNYVLLKGELLMNLTAQSLKDEFLGRVCLKDDDEPALLNQRICAFYPTGEWDIRRYLFLYFKSPQFRSYVDTLDSGTLIKHMHSKQLIEHELQLPTISEQHEIVRRVEILFAYADRLAARYQAARAQVERLTPALLAKAFRGELVPQDPADEPAGVLLARVRAARG